MTIPKAIEILEQDLKDQFNNPVFGLNVAKALGIEALKRWQEYRARGMGWWMSLLPGETEE